MQQQRPAPGRPDLPEVREARRMISPAPAPQALASDGNVLWMGSWETQKLYGFKPPEFDVFEKANAPGRPVGMTAIGETLRVVCSEGDDNRYIRRYVPGHGFVMTERIECPEDTGSFLAYDGEHLWLSQRYNMRLLQLDAQYRVAHEIALDAQIIGFVWALGSFYVSTWHGKDGGGCKIGRIDKNPERVTYVATVPYAAISLAHDGARFWTNDPRENAIVSFSLPLPGAATNLRR